jgi:hypothetical protein
MMSHLGGMFGDMTNDWGGRVGEEIDPGSWDECLGLLLSSGGNSTLYRGHRRFDWKLQSSLERALLLHAERCDERKYQIMQSMSRDEDTESWAANVELRLTRTFRINAERYEIADLPASWDKLGWWEVMQHHGAPTRLMDWTLSPFVALWFALDGHEDDSGDMALLIYDIRNAAVNHAGAQSMLDELENDEQLNDRKLLNQFVRFAIDDGNPALIPVAPRQFSRAVAQQSMLTVSPSISVGGPANAWIRKRLATRLRLREEWKSEMIATCQSMGLDRPSLFRDLDSLGSYISRTFIDGTDVDGAIF